MSFSRVGSYWPLVLSEVLSIARRTTATKGASQPANELHFDEGVSSGAELAEQWSDSNERDADSGSTSELTAEDDVAESTPDEPDLLDAQLARRSATGTSHAAKSLANGIPVATSERGETQGGHDMSRDVELLRIGSSVAQSEAGEPEAAELREGMVELAHGDKAEQLAADAEATETSEIAYLKLDGASPQYQSFELIRGSAADDPSSDQPELQAAEAVHPQVPQRALESAARASAAPAILTLLCRRVRRRRRRA